VAATVKLSADGNILLKDGKVSCSCCGCPVDLTCEMLLNDELPEGVTGGPWEFVADVDEDPTPPSQNWIRDRSVFWTSDEPFGTGRKRIDYGSCLRFLCVGVTYNQQTDESSFGYTAYCGPTCNERDLFELVFDNVPESTWKETRTLIFKIIFYGWIEYVQLGAPPLPSKRIWRECSDTAFTIVMREVTEN
jgi:hypothetical protein